MIFKMNLPKEWHMQLIKTPCGRSKYYVLANKKDFIGRIRLAWFILFAAIRDWNLPSPDKG